jgi:hypothetical protein
MGLGDSARVSGAVVPSPGEGVGNSKGCQVQVDARTLDVTITVTGLET